MLPVRQPRATPNVEGLRRDRDGALWRYCLFCTVGEKRNILCERRTAGGNILGQIKEGQRGRGGRRGKRGRAAASTVELSRVEEGTKRWFLYNPFTAAAAARARFALSRVIVPRRRDVLRFRAALRLWGRRWAPSSFKIWCGGGEETRACHHRRRGGKEREKRLVKLGNDVMQRWSWNGVQGKSVFKQPQEKGGNQSIRGCYSPDKGVYSWHQANKAIDELVSPTDRDVLVLCVLKE